jgi:hypothetical protein
MASRRHRSRSVLVVIIGAAFLAACGTPGATSSAPPTAPPTPHAIVATDPDTIAFVRPDSGADTWVLSGPSLDKTVTLLQLSSGRKVTTVGVDAGAADVAESADGVLAVAAGSGSSGTLDLYGASDGRLLSQRTLAGPALAVAAGADTRSFWVLEQAGRARTVTEFSSAGTPVGVAVPVSPNLTAIATSSDQSALWGLLSDGTIEEIGLPSGGVTTSISTGQAATALALSPSGGTAYVLRSALAAPNAAAVNLNTESVTTVYPAPAHSVDVVASADGRRLYFAASTAAFGNIQSLELHA